MRYLPLIIFFTLLSSCQTEQELDYLTKDFEPKLILHGFISPQKGVELVLKKSLAPNNVQGVDTVSNSLVFLHKSKNEFTQLTKTGQYYYSLDSVEYIIYGKQYYVRVENSTFGNISSSKQYIHLTPIIDSAIYMDDIVDYINIYFTNNYTNNTAFYISYSYYYNGELEEDMYEEKFNPFEIIQNTKLGSNIIQRKDLPRFDSVRIALHVLSDDLSKFLISQDKYDFTMNDPFYPQTYPVYTNIVGGYGIFASHSFSSVVVKKHN